MLYLVLRLNVRGESSFYKPKLPAGELIAVVCFLFPISRPASKPKSSNCAIMSLRNQLGALKIIAMEVKVDFHCRVNNYVRKTCAKKTQNTEFLQN